MRTSCDVVVPAPDDGSRQEHVSRAHAPARVAATLSFTAAASQAITGGGSLTGLSAGTATVAVR